MRGSSLIGRQALRPADLIKQQVLHNQHILQQRSSMGASLQLEPCPSLYRCHWK